ncbi:hypothetical protein FBEOM_4603 [Fusarium beomiforme]|uniref:Uncharacterized protein n=1 Tax=Fusarium beomiforme TaxID=44412 RepID=A0A9P5DXX6_9HYPO|nr:hypothetical protein FBEOM_4603 [Fusarium beomiforme]
MNDGIDNINSNGGEDIEKPEYDLNRIYPNTQRMHSEEDDIDNDDDEIGWLSESDLFICKDRSLFPTRFQYITECGSAE